MAEIRSTMDLVMERAARIGKASIEELQQEEARKKGMQLTAEFLNGTRDSLLTVLQEQAPVVQVQCRKGMAESLLRNIGLPREEHQRERAEKALLGVLELGGRAGDMVAICNEISHILGQYNQHREQLQQQLEDQIRMQYEHLLAQQGGMMREGMKIDPRVQPKFKEEWARIEAELNSQYNQALEERRHLLLQRF